MALSESDPQHLLQLLSSLLHLKANNKGCQRMFKLYSKPYSKKNQMYVLISGVAGCVTPYFGVDVSTHSLGYPRCLVELGSPLLLWVSLDICHQLVHKKSSIKHQKVTLHKQKICVCFDTRDLSICD